MDFLKPETFFDLSSFAHRSLWKPGLAVWSALEEIQHIPFDLGSIEIEIPEGVFLKNRELISIGKGTVIELGAMIEGPCIIGENCKIGHGAYLRGFCILGDRCSVGHSAEIKRSIVLNDAAVTHFVYVGDSIIGNKVNLGAGVKCSNLRLDRKEICCGPDRVATGLKKMGSIIGDGVQIGCNCVLNPGTLIGKRAICYPLLNVGGFVKEGSVLKDV